MSPPQAGHVGTADQLAQRPRLAFSTSVGPRFKGSDLAELITVGMGFAPRLLFNVVKY